jgi:hypothetical protein
MIVNPRADLKFKRNNGVIAAVKVIAPVKGEGLKVTTIDRTKNAELFTFFLIYSALQNADGALASLSDAEQTRLEEMGFLIRGDQVAEPVFYECDVGATPLDLLPERWRERSRPTATTLGDIIVDPTLRVLGEGGPPAEMRGRYNLANPFRTDRSWFSVDGDLAAPTFYSCSHELARQLALLVAGRTTLATLPPEARASLLNAGVLRPAAEVGKRRITGAKAFAAARRQLIEDRHVLLPEVIRPLQLAAIRRYYRKLLDEGFVRFGDAEWPNRYFAGKDPLTYFFQQQLTDVISAIVGQRVRPTFSYFTSYRPGSDLKPHRDREQCHYAMSVLLDHGQPDDVSSWPIYVQPPGSPSAIPVYAGLGDGLLYFGVEVLHYRYTLTEGYSTLWFLFWVPETFNGSLD